VLVNPETGVSRTDGANVLAAAHSVGLQTLVLNVSTEGHLLISLAGTGEDQGR
jgi:hypothetical protein